MPDISSLSCRPLATLLTAVASASPATPGPAARSSVPRVTGETTATRPASARTETLSATPPTGACAGRGSQVREREKRELHREGQK